MGWEAQQSAQSAASEVGHDVLGPWEDSREEKNIYHLQIKQKVMAERRKAAAEEGDKLRQVAKLSRL